MACAQHNALIFKVRIMKMGSGEFHGFRKSSHTGQEVWGYYLAAPRGAPEAA